MRYILLLITVAIIYIVFTRMSSMNRDEKAEVTQALNAAGTPAPGGLPVPRNPLPRRLTPSKPRSTAPARSSTKSASRSRRTIFKQRTGE